MFSIEALKVQVLSSSGSGSTHHMSGLERVSVEVREAEALLRGHIAVLQLLGVAQELVCTWVWVLELRQ